MNVILIKASHVAKYGGFHCHYNLYKRMEIREPHRPIINTMQLNNSNYGGLVPNSAFLGSRLKKVNSRFTTSNMGIGNFKTVAEYDEEKQTEKDKWRGLAFDTSDDQQDITRGKGLAPPLFQAPMGTGTHNAIMSSYDYVSAGLRQ